MKDKMAVITKRAYNAQHIGTIQLADDCFDDKDSGWRLFYGDEDDHVLDRMECFRIIALEEAVKICPELENIIYSDGAEHSYYHLSENSGFQKGDSFNAPDAPDADPFLSAFTGNGR